MFNIHLVRAQWDDMPTALALEKVMERARTDDPEELKKLTGLSKEKIKDYKLILDLPERYKQLIWDGLPMNFFVEIEENVIRPLTRQRPLVWQEFGGDAIRDAFLAKRDAGALTDVVDVRKMRPIIKRAAEDAGGPETASPFDDVIRDLILDPASSIEESYAEVALAGVELSRLAGSARSLIAAVDRLIGVTEGNESEREQLRTVVTDTQVALQARLDALPE
ncbi:MAG: ParB family transcriptional regulator, chromosome partitioning protein [Thermoleophilaceae bacterium]|nr:ParB family transcriptional regulator, chromosome partitioning protein [Thermoleophilaceae bacterium]